MNIFRINNKYVAVAIFLMLAVTFTGTGLWCIAIYVTETACK